MRQLVERTGHVHIGMIDWSTPEETLATVDHMLTNGCDRVIIHRPHGSDLHYMLAGGERTCVYNSWAEQHKRTAIGQCL